MVEAITSGYAGQLIADSAWEQQLAIEQGDRVIVGVNEFVDDDRSTGGIEMFKLDPGVQERQLARLEQVKRERDDRRVAETLKALERAAPDTRRNVMPEIHEAVRARATVGEISDVLRGVWGQYHPSTVF
jgi:methylmalonyl-CoA mutase N-terminal domain/subunit